MWSRGLGRDTHPLHEFSDEVLYKTCFPVSEYPWMTRETGYMGSFLAGFLVDDEVGFLYRYTENRIVLHTGLQNPSRKRPEILSIHENR